MNIFITNYFINFRGILCRLKLASTRVYTVTAAEGLDQYMGTKPRVWCIFWFDADYMFDYYLF